MAEYPDLRNGAGSERRLPLTKTEQNLLSGDGEGVGVASGLGLVGVAVLTELTELTATGAGAVGLRVEMPIAKATVATGSANSS
jgi:hypothetical protein